MEKIAREKFRELLMAFMEKNNLTVSEIAEVLPYSIVTLNSIISGETLPSDGMLKQVGEMLEHGFERFSKSKKAEKENISEAITRENFRALLVAFMEKNDLSVKKVAKAITCSIATLNRLILGKTLPSNEMLKQVGTMFGLGFERFSKLTNDDKENISEAIGAVGGGILGFGTITGAISSLGVSGVSAVGISTGLAALGGLVGGGMVTGVSVAAVIPIGVGAIGYGIVKAVKVYWENHQIDQEGYDPFWERPLEFDE